MSGAGADIDDSREGEDLDLDALVQACARKAARRQGLADWADDLAQEVRLLLWKAHAAAETVDPRWITRKANSIARNEARRRRKCADMERKVANEGGDAHDLADDTAAGLSDKGIPGLCEGFARLIEPGRAGRVLQHLILACALAVIEDVLGTKRGSGRRYMVFRAAYEKHTRIGSLAAKFKKSPDAIREQLRRMSMAVQSHLLARLDLPTHVALAIAAKTADPVAAREPVRRALEAFLVEAGDASPGAET